MNLAMYGKSYHVLYVNEILISTNDINFIHDTEKFWSNNLEMKDLDDASLRVRFTRSLKIHNRRSNKIYNSKLIMTRI